MSVIQVVLVDTTQKLNPQLVQATASALNIQAVRDLPQYWSVQATVRWLQDPNQIPAGVWPVFLVAQLPPGEGGVHLDKSNQPYALVIGTPASDDWTIDASHETIEMLVDPAGNRMQTSDAIKIEGNSVADQPGQYSYLVEACDPCEGNQYAYGINGVAVSDFITPHFYDPVATKGTRYSFGGNVERPRQVLPGGYISFIDPNNDHMEQILFLGSKPELRDLGPADGKLRSLRQFVDDRTRQEVHKARKPNQAMTSRMKKHRDMIDHVAERRGRGYRELYMKSSHN
jgi:hypothetical protein